MRKLLIVDHTVSAGGVERFLHGLVEGLLTLPEVKQWDITLLLSRYNSGGYPVKWPKHLRAPNVHVRYFFEGLWPRLVHRVQNPRRIYGIPGSGRIQRAVRWSIRHRGPSWLRRYVESFGDHRQWIEQYCLGRQFDVTYFSYPYGIACPRIASPMVATPHDFNYKRFRTWDDPARALIDRTMPEWLRSARCLIVSSEFMASEFRHFYPEAADKVRIVRLGIPRGNRIPTPAEVQNYRRRIGLPEQFLLTAGWIVPHKNQKVLFEALGRLRRKGIDIPLVCIGPNSHHLCNGGSNGGGYVREVLELSRDLSFRESRDFFGLGYVDDFSLECLYRLATALVVPSLYEAGSFPAREAMQAGLPVILSGIPSLVEENRLIEGNAWMFEATNPQHLAEVIEEVLAKPDERLERAQRAARIVPSVFSWAKTAAGYFSVFQQLSQ